MEFEWKDLPEALKTQVDAQIEQAIALEEQGQFQQAEQVYQAALALIPEPKHAFWETTRIYVGFGEIHFVQGQFEQAAHFYQECMKMPEGFINPFVLLRRGQIAFEQDDAITAAEHLTRALMLEGTEIFDEEDPKYLDFLKTVLKAPLGGW